MADTSIKAAAEWLLATPYNERPHPLIPHMKREFSLTPVQIAEAIREADRIRGMRS